MPIPGLKCYLSTSYSTCKLCIFTALVTIKINQIAECGFSQVIFRDQIARSTISGLYPYS